MNPQKRLYAGGHPNWLATVLNRCSAAVHALGIAPNYLVTLGVPGRRSGRTASLPLVSWLSLKVSATSCPCWGRR